MEKDNNEFKTTQDTNIYDETLVEDVLKLSTRARYALRRAGVRTIDDLMFLTKKDLLKVRNCGKKTTDEINSALDGWLGYHFERKENEDYVGMVNTINNGIEATIIYTSGVFVDVQFEDGFIAKKQYISDFKKGKIKHPKEYIGVTNTMNNGMAATIIAYRDEWNIDVEFEDGTISRNNFLDDFEDGNIKNPKEYIGMTNTMNNGQKCTIIAYRSYRGVDVWWIDVKFEDGTVVYNKTINQFELGNIGKR